MGFIWWKCILIIETSVFLLSLFSIASVNSVAYYQQQLTLFHGLWSIAINPFVVIDDFAWDDCAGLTMMVWHYIGRFKTALCLVHKRIFIFWWIKRINSCDKH